MKIARTTHIRTEPLGCIVSYVQLLLSLINFRSRGHVFLSLSLFSVCSRMIITFGFFLTRHLGPFATFHESIDYSLDPSPSYNRSYTTYHVPSYTPQNAPYTYFPPVSPPSPRTTISYPNNTPFHPPHSSIWHCISVLPGLLAF